MVPFFLLSTRFLGNQTHMTTFLESCSCCVLIFLFFFLATKQDFNFFFWVFFSLITGGSAMSATIISDPNPMILSNPEIQQVASATTTTSSATTIQAEVEFAICDCCGLTEECTPAYIERIRERYHGKWVCGLCAEAVKDEILRAERLVSTEEAMARHMNFCKKFKSSGPPTIDPTVHLISAMRQILRRSLDSPRGLRLRSTPSSPTKILSQCDTEIRTTSGLTRSESCFPSLSGS